MVVNQEIITRNSSQTQAVGERLAASLKLPTVLCLYGELGSGKTTFTQGFARGLGITTRLPSPTFIIVRRYRIPEHEKFLYHIDLYRLGDAGDFEEIGLSEILADPGSYVVIEWADRLGDGLPQNRVDVHFSTGENGTHRIRLESVMTDSSVSNAVGVLRRGGVVIFPTDTAFGIGCRIDDKDAVDRLFTLRKRPRNQATPVLVSSIDMALAYLDHPPHVVRRLMERYWPGGLTIVARCKKNLIYSPIRGGGNTVGLRMPNHQTILTMIKKTGVPILGPSANFHGDATPYRESDLSPKLIALVDLVVSGECPLKQASTVVDCAKDEYTIIRQGAVRLP